MENLQLSLFGKMSPELLAPTKARTSEKCLKKSPKSQMNTFQFLDLTKESGLMREKSWETVTVSRGECLTRNFGEYPNEESVSTLSQILQTGAPEEYYSSAKACQGILQRAEKRGKELPKLLKAALEAQTEGKLLVTSEQDFQSAGFIGKASPSAGNIGFEEEVGATLKAEQVTHVIEGIPVDNCKCLTSWDYQNKRVFDENGSYPCMSSGERSGADFTAVLQSEILDMAHANDVVRECGEVSPTLQTRMSRNKKQHSLVFQKAAHPRSSEEPQVWKEADVAHTLNTFSYNENRCDELIVEPTYCIQGNTIDRSDTAGANGKGVIEGKSYTLNTVDRPAVAYAVGIHPNNSSTAAGVSECEEKSPTLSVTKQVAVCCAVGNVQAVAFENSSFGGYKQGVGTLKASGGDYGGGSENLICQPCSYNSSGNDIDGTLDAHYYLGCGARGGIEREFVATPIDGNNNFYVWIARRLTPLECCRLQGYPDWWAKDLNTAEPTEEDLTFWADVFETHRKATDPLKKPKNKKAIKKWLQDPQTDSAEYKMWGNSLAIPCAYTVLAGIAEEMREEL